MGKKIFSIALALALAICFVMPSVENARQNLTDFVETKNTPQSVKTIENMEVFEPFAEVPKTTEEKNGCRQVQENNQKITNKMLPLSAVQNFEKDICNVPEEVFETQLENGAYSGNSDALSISFDNVSIDLQNKKITAEIGVTSKETLLSGAYIFVILYDQSGQMLSYNSKEIYPISGSKSYVVPVTYFVPGAGHRLKAVLWDKNYIPLCDAIERGIAYNPYTTSLYISSSKTVLNLVTGETTTLSAVTQPANMGVEFYSSDESVLKVNQNGVVTPIGEGNAMVTAISADKSASDTIVISVFSGATSISLNQTTVNMWESFSYTLKAAVTPYVTSEITYTSSNTNVATVSKNGVVKGVRKGTAVITAKCDRVSAKCTVNVYAEADYISTIAAKYESDGDPGAISSGWGDYGGASYGVFQLSSASNGPKNFYNWLISSGRNVDIGNRLRNAHNADGGRDYSFGNNFNNVWKQIANSQYNEFYSCQVDYFKVIYYDPLVSTVLSRTGFDASTHSIGLKAGFYSRAIQHGVTGAANRIVTALNSFSGGWRNKTDREIIQAIYRECGLAVSYKPDPDSIPMNSSSSIAVQYGLVGLYMRYYSLNSSDIQASVWRRLNINEPNDIYYLMDYPPVYITPQN